jgi:hypothetical protein
MRADTTREPRQETAKVTGRAVEVYRLDFPRGIILPDRASEPVYLKHLV